jgi:tetratricopeptide (TPR) repeat protein
VLLQQSHARFPDLPRVGFALAEYGMATHTEKMVQQGMESVLAVMDTIQEATQEELCSELCFEFFVWYKVRFAFIGTPLNPRLEEGLQRCHALFPENGDVLRAISQVQLDQRQWERAKATLLKAKAVVEEGRAAKEVLLQLAYVYDKTDQVDQVETLLREAIAQYPDDAQVYNFLGYTYADRNIKLEEAQSLIEKACQLNPNDGNIVDSLGWLYYRQGRYKEAIEQLERANQLEEDHPVILDHLGDALLKDGRIEDAVASWKKSLECGPDFPTEFTPEFQRQVSSKIKEAEKLNQP